MNDQKNLVLAIALSMVVIIAYQLLFLEPQKQAQQAQQTEQAQSTQQATGDGTAPGPAPGDAAIPTPPGGGAAPAAERGDVLAAAPRIEINTPSVRGSIRLAGARLDDLVLTDYHQTVDPQSPEIVLFSPTGSGRPYYAQYGWIAAKANAAPKLPVSDTEWTASGGPLAPGQPVTLTWDNGEGLHFERVVEIDGDYMLTITQRVRNDGDAPVELLPYGLVARLYIPETLGFYILHEGPLGVFNDTLTELDYDDLAEDGPITEQSTGGWLGITDKYWLAALIPDQQAPITARFLQTSQDGSPRVQVDYLGQARVIEPGATAETTSRLFAGAKRVDLIEGYQERYGIERFDLAIDWGWFYFLTKPIYHILHWIYAFVGNYGVAIILLTVFLKLLMFPLANKSYKSMAKLKKLQPKMLELREKYGDDKQRLNQEMMALYKKEGANPASGCLPILVQIPVFFALYKVLFVTIEMRHAPFFGWIRDLSAPDPTTIFNLFGLIPWTPPEWLIPIGVWPLVMGGTMWLQQKLNPQPPDPVQAKVMMFLPVIFTVLLASFPAGLVVYWTCNNLLSVAQQWVIMRTADAKPVPAGTPAPVNQGGANPGAANNPGSGKTGGRRKAPQKKQKKA